MSDPTDEILHLIQEGAPDVLSRIADVLGMPSKTPVVEDLAILVRQLVVHLRRCAAPGSPAIAKADAALDYLKRNGLAGTPLRTKRRHRSNWDHHCTSEASRACEAPDLCWKSNRCFRDGADQPLRLTAP